MTSTPDQAEAITDMAATTYTRWMEEGYTNAQCGAAVAVMLTLHLRYASKSIADRMDIASTMAGQAVNAANNMDAASKGKLT